MLVFFFYFQVERISFKCITLSKSKNGQAKKKKSLKPGLLFPQKNSKVSTFATVGHVSADRCSVSGHISHTLYFSRMLVAL